MRSAIPSSSKSVFTGASMTREHDPMVAALRWALAAYLAPQDAHDAALQWQPSAPGASTLAGLSRYCRTVAQQFDLKGREAELHLHIIRALQTLPRASPTPPPVLATPPDTDAGAHSVPGQPLARTTSGRLVQVVVDAMGEQVRHALGDEVSPAQWRQSVAAGLRQARLRGDAAVLAQGWLEGRWAVLPGVWPSRGEGTRLINAAYVALAGWLGPVQADACLSGIVRDCEQGGDTELRAVRSYL